jgi:hypothetical protein
VLLYFNWKKYFLLFCVTKFDAPRCGHGRRIARPAMKQIYDPGDLHGLEKDWNELNA